MAPHDIKLSFELCLTVSETLKRQTRVLQGCACPDQARPGLTTTYWTGVQGRQHPCLVTSQQRFAACASVHGLADGARGSATTRALQGWVPTLANSERVPGRARIRTLT
jgi:hypothetical protein